MSGDERHLRIVAPPAAPPSVVQIAGYPGAYAVRRGGQAEALYSRQTDGRWHVMYGHNPSATDPALAWRGMATLPGDLDDGQVIAAAVELVDAYECDPGTAWHRLLAAAYANGPVAAAVARLHQPEQRRTAGEPLIVCTGCGVEDDPPEWRCCTTVRVLARHLRVALNSPGGQ